MERVLNTRHRGFISRRICWWRLYSALLVIAVFVPGFPPASAQQPALRLGSGAGSVDGQLKKIYEHVQQRRLNSALEEADRLIARHPNFRLAHLIRGDLLLARRQPIAALGNAGTDGRDRVDELRAEAAVRLRAYADVPAADVVPRYLLQFSPMQKHAIVVDAARSRVYLYENAGGVPRLLSHYYTSIGKRGMDKTLEGDQKTPIGVYNVSSHIPGAKLPDLYGWGAYPINYPNEWDRIRGRTGYGIWLHGVPSDNYARAPRASDGCVALANPDIAEIATRVQVGVTPVVIAEQVEWLSTATWRTERDQFLSALEAWRRDWESLNTERYLGHYAKSFRSEETDFAGWVAHKRRVNVAKSWSKISLSDVSIFRSPGKQDLIVATFAQDYRSSTHSEQSRKRQYWITEAGRWKIAYEAPVHDSALAYPESFRQPSPLRSRETRLHKATHKTTGAPAAMIAPVLVTARADLLRFDHE